MSKSVGGSAVGTICTKKVQNSKEGMRKEERSRKIQVTMITKLVILLLIMLLAIM
jgi:predicted nucleic acid-binding Zn ribbon protein